MSALMLTGCADKIPTYDSVANGKASVAVEKAEETKKAAATTTTTATTATTTNILTGNFYEINGCNDCFQYGMTCTANGSVLSYECGSYSLHK